MRPRITSKEAEFIVELLEASQSIHEQTSRYFFLLEKEVNRLNTLRTTQPYEAFRHGLTEKRNELTKWKVLRWGLAATVDSNQRITKRFY